MLGVKGIGNEVKVVVDSDWAGCTSTRKSTNGRCVMVGDVCLKAWSTTQTVVALSGGEAGCDVAAKETGEGLGFRAGCPDLGIWDNERTTPRVMTDSSACKGIRHRTGPWKVRHTNVALLWLHDLVTRGKIAMTKNQGKDNQADMLTKYSTDPRISDMSRSLGFHLVGVGERS